MSTAFRAEDFLPSLETARAAGMTLKTRVWWRLGTEVDLMEREPEEERRLAAIVVRGRAMRRLKLAQRVDVPARSASRVPEPMPPIPDAFEPATTTVWTHVLTEQSRCSWCHEGRLLCGLCGGNGQMIVEAGGYHAAPRVQWCISCDRSGTHICNHCAGTSLSVQVRSVDVIDQVAHIAYPYVPTMTFGIEEKVVQVLEAEIAEDLEVPDCLEIGLAPDRTGGPYRQAVREPAFRGFSYGDALEQARLAVATARGDEPIRDELEVHARPILWLRYKAWNVRREVALFYGLSGQLYAMVGDGGI